MKSILLIALLTATTLIAQSTDPKPVLFNWGTYTAPFHDSTHAVTKTMVGWEWGGGDSAFDKFMYANITHSDSWDNDVVKNMNFVINYEDYTMMCMRYDAEVIPVISSAFKPYKYDSTGAVFGWANRSSTICVRDTATTSNKGIGRINMSGGSTGLALSDIQPKQFYKRLKENSINEKVNPEKFLLTVNLRRHDSTNTDTTNATGLTIKLNYWSHEYVDSLDANVYYNDHIKFDSLPNQNTWHSRGFWDSQKFKVDTTLPPEDQQVFDISRKLLPIHDSNAVSRDVTLSATFTLDGIRNPRLAYELESDNKSEVGFHIDSMDIEVYYQGFPVDVDFVCIEVPKNRYMYQGQYDTLIKNDIQTKITSLRTTRPDLKVLRISTSIESRLCWNYSMRYVNSLLNGFSTSVNASELPLHSLHIIPQKTFWSFGVINGVWGILASPVLPYIDTNWICKSVQSIDTSTTPDDTTWNHYCGDKQPSLGYDCGYFPFQDTLLGDTLKSCYEMYICDTSWQRLSRAQIQAIDTLSLSQYLKYSHKSFQGFIDQHIAEHFYKYGDYTLLYSGIPLWTQKQLLTEYYVEKYEYDTVKHVKMNTGMTRTFTGEETRYILWNDIIKGYKGILADNGGNYPINYYPFFSHDTAGKTSLRRTFDNPYNDNSPYDTDYLVNNDPTNLNKYMLKARIVNINNTYDTNKIYLGLRSMRHVTRDAFAFMTGNSNELMRMRLVSWISKGFKTYYSGDTTNFSRAMFIQKDSVLVRPIGRVNLDNRPLYEPRDSTFYDITLLRDSSDSGVMLDSVFYIGVCNKRTDPLRYIHYPFNDTVSPKRLLFLSSAEFEDSCKVSIDSTQWRELKYKQLGTREITIPFNYSHWDGKQHILRVQEIGGSLDTVISSHSKLPVILLPGEGKIFRVTIPSATASVALGDIQNSNQRKLVCYPKVEYDIGNNSFRELDTVYYHMCYHRVDTSDSRLKVYYRRSVPSIRGHVPVAGLQWQNEICLSQQPVIKLNYDTATMQAAYPSIVVRNDSVNRIPRVYVVFACEQNNS
ncbi:MAG: hypothetical protein K1X91_17250, partial [Bacteriodetes bacterium]|nr:hypothetical protein [Bacteroidota bacterium]